MPALGNMYPGYPGTVHRGVGARWLALIEGMDNGRLRRGRSYARAGHVASVAFTEEGVDARVRGSSYTPYHVRIRIPPIPGPVWEAVLEGIAADAQLVAAVLTGDLPPEIERLLAEHHQRLFPTTLVDGEDDCTCYDWSRPCKHIAAVYYVLADVLEADPHAIFTLRGMPREQVFDRLEAIREQLLAERFGPADPMEIQQAGGDQEPEPPPDFWTAALPLDTIPVRAEPPSVHAAPLKALGPAPYGYDYRAFLTKAEQIYGAISQAGLRLLVAQAQAAGQDTLGSPPQRLPESEEHSPDRRAGAPRRTR